MRDEYLLARISVRLGSLKPLWLAHCRNQGASPSDALRELISRELSAPQRLGIKEVHRENLEDVVCIEIRLGKAELSYARELSATEGYRSVNRWMAACVRSRLSNEAQFGREEIAVLAQSNYQMAALGRNLNQLVKDVRQFKEGVKDHRYAVIKELGHFLRGHVDLVSTLIKSNYDRWR